MDQDILRRAGYTLGFELAGSHLKSREGWLPSDLTDEPHAPFLLIEDATNLESKFRELHPMKDLGEAHQ